MKNKHFFIVIAIAVVLESIQLTALFMCLSELKEIKQSSFSERKGLEQIDIDLSLKDRYKIYQTENIYNLLQLDTKTGIINQVQWALDDVDKYEFTSIINAEDLSNGQGHGSGSFELYPTKNMYQFILLDQTTGRKWHVQWGTEENKKWIRPIR